MQASGLQVVDSTPGAGMAPLSRAARVACRTSRTEYEPTALEAEDSSLLERMKRRKVAEMPWAAKTRRQWEEDLSRTEREVLSSQRGAAYLCSAQAWRVEKAPELRPSSFSQKSSSSRSSSSSSSGSSSSSALGAGAAALAAAPAGTPTGDVPKLISWIRPARGNLHKRVDCSSGVAVTGCRPQHAVRPGYEHGETGVSASRTKAKWCSKCVAMFFLKLEVKIEGKRGPEFFFFVQRIFWRGGAGGREKDADSR